MLERMSAAGKGPEVPPGYEDALNEYRNLGHSEQEEVMRNFTKLRETFMKAKTDIRKEKIEEMFEAGQGRIPPDVSISSEEDKGYFVIAVNKFLQDKKNAVRIAEKQQFREPMSHEDIDGGHK